MRTRCYCGHHSLNPENATYVKDGRPLCLSTTCERAALRQSTEQAKRDAETVRQIRGLLRVPHFDDGAFDVVA